MLRNIRLKDEFYVKSNKDRAAIAIIVWIKFFKHFGFILEATMEASPQLLQ